MAKFDPPSGGSEWTDTGSNVVPSGGETIGDGTDDADLGSLNTNESISESVPHVDPTHPTFGAEGDGTTDDTAAFDAALSSLGDQGVVAVPPGTYAVNLTITDRYHIVGTGDGPTEFVSADGSSPVIRYENTGTWDFIKLKDVSIRGDGTHGYNGIVISPDPAVTDGDFLTGRIIFDMTVFEDNLNKAVVKNQGNIGNRFIDCTFEGANYHYYATPDSSTHSGADTFVRGHYRNAKKASIYWSSSGTGRGLLFDNPIIEGNSGFGVWIDGAGITSSPTVKFDSTWFESNASASSVTINGTSETPRSLRFDGCHTAIFDDIRLQEIELNNSSVVARNCGTGDNQLSLIKDADSFFVSRDMVTDRNENTDMFAVTPQVATRAAGGFASYFLTTPRETITSNLSAGTLVYSESFDADTESHGGQVTTSTGVRDGILFDRCQEASIPSGDALAADVFQLASDKWTLATIDMKPTSNPGNLQVSFVSQDTLANLGAPCSTNDWHSFSIITKTTSSFGARMRLEGSGGSTTVRFSALQVVQFDDLQDLIEYNNKKLFALNGRETQTRGTTAPTNGTWQAGDLVFDESPTSGGHVGWVCVSGGSPGTWQTFGDIT